MPDASPDRFFRLEDEDVRLGIGTPELKDRNAIGQDDRAGQAAPGLQYRSFTSRSRARRYGSAENKATAVSPPFSVTLT